MLKLSDLADKIAPHLIGVSTPFGGALAKNYIGANISDSDDTLPTGEDLDKVKADAQAGIDKANAGVDKANAEVEKANAGVDKANAGVDKANAGVDKANAGLENVNQEINNLKNEMENVGFKVMSHIPDLSNGQDLDPSTIKDPRTAITTYLLQQHSGTSEPYITLNTPLTQTTPVMVDSRQWPWSLSNFQIQIQLEVHDYPIGAIPWYYFHFTPYAKITAIRVKLGNTIGDAFIQRANDISGIISEGMSVPLNSSIVHSDDYDPLKTPQSALTLPPSRIDYTDPRDGTNYNDTPAMMAIIPYGNWDAKNNNGSWSITQGSTAGGLYIAVYKGKCICYDLQVGNGPAMGGWTKRYGQYASGYGIGTYGLIANYKGPDGQQSVSYN